MPTRCSRSPSRDVAKDIRKVLASAVANAVHNDEQDADELFVLACFADEGPTLRRFRPRARGRATRIRKRTCHITVVVARMSDERLDVVQARQEAQSAAGRRRAGTSAQSRRDRVERSRARAQGLKEGATAEPDAFGDDTAEADDDTQAVAEEPTLEHGEADSEGVEPSTEASEASAEHEQLPDGAVAAPEDGSVPEGYEIKGNANSMKYHVPGGRYYDITIGDVFFDTVEHAEAAGYEGPLARRGRHRRDD